jgi:glyoxylase-like metal-dependent hydrolase (beta-lactamase superfamily II)
MRILFVLSCCWLSSALAQTASTVTLTRLDCGNEPEPTSVASFSDTYGATDLKIQLTYSCYLIRHGDEYMIWDAGNRLGGGPESPKASLVELLRKLKIKPEQVKYLGISHHHYDHIGQAASFPQATLLIGKGDWEALTAEKPPERMTPDEFTAWRSPLAPWISGGSKVEPQSRDKKDVFGDGTVVMLSLPGHTPGHHGLLVRLAQMGPVLLSGDATHFHENYKNNGVPTWNFNRADTLASLDRFREVARNLRATVIIQHDPRDIDKLPAFPAAAR